VGFCWLCWGANGVKGATLGVSIVASYVHGVSAL